LDSAGGAWGTAQAPVAKWQDGRMPFLPRPKGAGSPESGPSPVRALSGKFDTLLDAPPPGRQRTRHLRRLAVRLPHLATV
jgi:hypothetical protein